MVDVLAQELKMDPAQLRMKNFIPKEKFPYKSVLGWEYDSGTIQRRLKKAMDIVGYDALRKEQVEKRKRGEFMGIGISSFTEIVGAGPSKHFDILGIKMFDSCELRVHPTGKATARFGTKSQGQGHETTYAQIIAEELGIPAAHVEVEEGDTDTAPYGLGTYASRSTPVAGAAGAIAARKVRDKARRSRRTCSRFRKTTSSGSPASSRSRARPRSRRPSRTSRLRRTRTIRRGWRRGWRRWTTTIRRT
jgi:carbon-monoxide dehydrogenase large subunit